MKIIQIASLFVFALALTFSASAEKKNKKDPNKTAEDIYEYVSNMKTFDKESAKALKEEMKTLTRKERKRLMDMALADAKKVKGQGEATTALYVLAVLLPPVAVGIYTGWDKRTLWNTLWWLLFWLPGVIHAFIVFGQ